jgi:SAM-dependent methyltransferase
MKPEEKEAAKNYDFMAEYYHNWRTKENPHGWFYNEMLEMPATLELVGDVRGKKILDFGCGSGIYAKTLTKRGAIVKGFDISEGMLEIARRENPALDLRQASGYKIPFKEKFDIVIAALVMDYFKDWDKVFREVKRVLKKDGIFIFSIGNPVAECADRIPISKFSNKAKYKGKRLRVIDEKSAYFKERKIYGVWKNINGKDIRMPTYHKTYETIIKTIIRNGFEISDYRDCFPIEKGKKLFPEDYSLFSKIPFFCAWKVRKK